MLLNGSVSSPGPRIPPTIRDRLTLLTTCQILPSEILAMNNALVAFAVLLDGDDQVPAGAFANIVFADTDTMSMSIDSPGNLGKYLPIIIYPLHRWREKRLTHLQMMTCVLEELCHCFWCIVDEELVEDKVLEALRVILPNVQKSAVYNPNWTPDDVG